MGPAGFELPASSSRNPASSDNTGAYSGASASETNPPAELAAHLLALADADLAALAEAVSRLPAARRRRLVNVLHGTLANR